MLEHVSMAELTDGVVPHSTMSCDIVEWGTNSIGQLAGPVRWSLKMACRIS